MNLVENVHLILEVAYLLAAMDGVILESEIVEFRNIARLLLGSRYEDAKKLMEYGDYIKWGIIAIVVLAVAWYAVKHYLKKKRKQ